MKQFILYTCMFFTIGCNNTQQFSNDYKIANLVLDERIERLSKMGEHQQNLMDSIDNVTIFGQFLAPGQLHLPMNKIQEVKKNVESNYSNALDRIFDLNSKQLIVDNLYSNIEKSIHIENSLDKYSKSDSFPRKLKIIFSRVGYNKNNEYAAIFSGYELGRLDAAMDLYFLKKSNGEWKIEKKENIYFN